MSAILKLTPSEESLLQLLPDGDGATGLKERGLPGRRTEDWRWSDLRSVQKEPIALSEAYAADLPVSPLQLEQPVELVFANGRMVREPIYLPPGVELSRVSERLERPAQPLAALAADLSEAVYRLEITGVVKTPILVRYLSNGSGMHQTRLQVELGAKARASLVECYEGSEERWLSNNLTEFTLQDGAHLTRTILQVETPEAITVATSLVGLGAEATLEQTGLGFGGKLVRLETHLSQAGPASRVILNGAYLLRGNNHLDHTTHVAHRAVEGETQELFKGVLQDRGCGVFQGKFYVARGAQKIDARMGHHALLLSDDAEVNAKPELEIYADDVECAHGNTAGALDDDALFYMRQRGLSEHQARAILVEAFVGEIMERIENKSLYEQLSGKVAEFIGGDA